MVKYNHYPEMNFQSKDTGLFSIYSTFYKISNWFNSVSRDFTIILLQKLGEKLYSSATVRSKCLESCQKILWQIKNALARETNLLTLT